MILRRLASTPACSSAWNSQIERVGRVLPLGRGHPFDQAVDDWVVLEAAFRAPAANCMRIAPLIAAVATVTFFSLTILTKEVVHTCYLT